MKSLKIALLLSFVLPFHSNAIRVAACEANDAEYVRDKFQSGAFVKQNQADKEFPRGTLKHSEICEVRNLIIMDGLAFTLYKPSEENNKYILVHNGLDGSSQLYGPFN